MQSIEITTTQHVIIEYELASVRDRIVAFFVDAFIVAVVYIAFFWLILRITGEELFDSGFTVSLFASLLPIAFFLLYQIVTETQLGQSFGKKIVGIKVVRLDGEQPSLGDHLLRSIFYIIDVLFSSGLLAILLISSSTKNQRLGDLAATTTVIKKRSEFRFKLKDILNIVSLEDYEPTYHQITKLEEKDMLIIKQALLRYRTYPNEAHQKIIKQLVEHLKDLLDIKIPIENNEDFLKTLIKDYIVLTR